jgi:hypothetical protein
MLQFKVKIREIIDILSHVMWNLLRVTVVCEVCMIDKNLNWEECAGKQMFPMVKAKDESHEFVVPDIIVVFCFGEFLRCSSNHKFLAVVILLEQGST